MFFDVFDILGILLWLAPLLVVGWIISLIVRYRNKKRKGLITQQKNWYLMLAFSKEDIVSQLFFLLALGFFGITLFALSKDFGNVLSWRIILLLTSAAGIFIAYYFRILYALPISLIGIGIWWGAQAEIWIKAHSVKSMVVVTGLMGSTLLLYGIGYAHARKESLKRFSLVYILLSIISVTVVLFMISTQEGLQELSRMMQGGALWYSWEITISLLLFVCATLGTLVYSLQRKFVSLWEVLSVALLMGVFGLFALLPEQNMFTLVSPQCKQGACPLVAGDELSSAGIFWAVVLNLLAFFETLGIIFSGYWRREKWLINLGVLFVFILILIKYFDWFFTFLDKSLFFIGAGILLFGIGWSMERGRRYMIETIQNNDK